MHGLVLVPAMPTGAATTFTWAPTGQIRLISRAEEMYLHTKVIIMHEHMYLNEAIRPA